MVEDKVPVVLLHKNTGRPTISTLLEEITNVVIVRRSLSEPEAHELAVSPLLKDSWKTSQHGF